MIFSSFELTAFSFLLLGFLVFLPESCVVVGERIKVSGKTTKPKITSNKDDLSSSLFKILEVFLIRMQLRLDESERIVLSLGLNGIQIFTSNPDFKF